MSLNAGKNVSEKEENRPKSQTAQKLSLSVDVVRNERSSSNSRRSKSTAIGISILNRSKQSLAIYMKNKRCKYVILFLILIEIVTQTIISKRSSKTWKESPGVSICQSNTESSAHAVLHVYRT